MRSERQFCQRLRYHLLFKWFPGQNGEDDAFDHSSFAKDRETLRQCEVGGRHEGCGGHDPAHAGGGAAASGTFVEEGRVRTRERLLPVAPNR